MVVVTNHHSPNTNHDPLFTQLNADCPSFESGNITVPSRIAVPLAYVLEPGSENIKKKSLIKSLRKEN